MSATVVVLDIVERLILAGMIGLSVWSIAVMLDRKKFFKSQLESFDLSQLKSWIETSSVADLQKWAKESSSYLGFYTLELLKAPQNSLGIEKSASSFAKIERKKIEKGLPFLATLGANAAFIGLLGTVLGIIRAFAFLGSQSGADSVMSGVSQALLATAVGLGVAIPAVVAYNIFSQKSKDLLMTAESIKDFYISRLK
jgi:biopolymer transport protein ExbB/TolQ